MQCFDLFFREFYLDHLTPRIGWQGI